MQRNKVVQQDLVCCDCIITRPDDNFALMVWIVSPSSCDLLQSGLLQSGLRLSGLMNDGQMNDDRFVAVR